MSKADRREQQQDQSLKMIRVREAQQDAAVFVKQFNLKDRTINDPEALYDVVTEIHKAMQNLPTGHSLSPPEPVPGFKVDTDKYMLYLLVMAPKMAGVGIELVKSGKAFELRAHFHSRGYGGDIPKSIAKYYVNDNQAALISEVVTREILKSIDAHAFGNTLLQGALPLIERHPKFRGVLKNMIVKQVPPDPKGAEGQNAVRTAGIVWLKHIKKHAILYHPPFFTYLTIQSLLGGYPTSGLMNMADQGVDAIYSISQYLFMHEMLHALMLHTSRKGNMYSDVSHTEANHFQDIIINARLTARVMKGVRADKDVEDNVDSSIAPQGGVRSPQFRPWQGSLKKWIKDSATITLNEVVLPVHDIDDVFGHPDFKEALAEENAKGFLFSNFDQLIKAGMNTRVIVDLGKESSRISNSQSIRPAKYRVGQLVQRKLEGLVGVVKAVNRDGTYEVVWSRLKDFDTFDDLEAKVSVA